MPMMPTAADFGFFADDDPRKAEHAAKFGKQWEAENADWNGYSDDVVRFGEDWANDAADTPTTRARYAEQDVLALVAACQRLLLFNQELCEEIGVSTNYPSAIRARAVLAKFAGLK